jgi:hypothetical protein
MIKFVRLTLCVLALALPACKEGPATVGELKNFAAVCDETNNGKRIAVTGYLQLPTTVKKRDEDVAVTLWLYETNTFKGLPIRVAVASGNTPNHLEKLPTTYSHNDMKVHLANGQVVGYGTQVKVSGTVYTPIVKQDNFKCGLTNPLFELAN